ncbi:MAG: hypothetical protein CMO21_02250 [Thioclava sp.]|nr:hypothetical protein [Thioclava sp.]
MPGAEVMAAALRETGIPHARLLLETRSRNTSENARLSLDLARPKPGETSLLVTSAFHMRRAMASFERAGWEEVVPYPVDYREDGFLDDIGWDLAGHHETLDLTLKDTIPLTGVIQSSSGGNQMKSSSSSPDISSGLSRSSSFCGSTFLGSSISLPTTADAISVKKRCPFSVTSGNLTRLSSRLTLNSMRPSPFPPFGPSPSTARCRGKFGIPSSSASACAGVPLKPNSR